MGSTLNNLVVVSDLHAGCGVGLCPPSGLALDEGGHYRPSKLQLKMWAHWRRFWDEWVPDVCCGEPYGVAVNGDLIDGVHHNSTTQITHNLERQRDLAFQMLRPVVRHAAGFWVLRGTEAHDGASSEAAEAVAKALGARPDSEGRHARWELWKRIGGKRGGLAHLSHHIGTTGATHYETSAVMKELSEALVEAGRWGDEPPRVVVRSHRHRLTEVRIPSAEVQTIGVVTPGWQLKTPFAFRMPGGRQAQPQLGGVVVRWHLGELYVRAMVERIERPAEE